MISINYMSNNTQKDISTILNIPNLICCWDFDGHHPFISKGKYAYQLSEGNGAITLCDEGIIGDTSIDIQEGQYLFIPGMECPALNIHGSNTQVTVLAWLKRKQKNYSQCEAIAGMWNETEKKRQYCLFLNLQLFESADQVCGHISGVGGPTPGQRWCIEASIGKQEVKYNDWSFVGFTYDSKEIKSYHNGELDVRVERNPYNYTEGIFDAGEPGSDFTVAAVHRLGEMGNNFVGQISGLAIFDRALVAAEIKKLFVDFPLPNDKV